MADTKEEEHLYFVWSANSDDDDYEPEDVRYRYVSPDPQVIGIAYGKLSNINNLMAAVKNTFDTHMGKNIFSTKKYPSKVLGSYDEALIRDIVIRKLGIEQEAKLHDREDLTKQLLELRKESKRSVLYLLKEKKSLFQEDKEISTGNGCLVAIIVAVAVIIGFIILATLQGE